MLWLPDSPVTARFLTAEERVAALERVRDGQGGVANRKLKKDQVIEAFTDIRTWLVVVTTLLSTSATYDPLAFLTLQRIPYCSQHTERWIKQLCARFSSLLLEW